VVLPDACVTAAHAKADLWVDVSVDGASIGRTKLGAVPYAVEAEHAVSATNATKAQTATTLAAGPVAGDLQVFTVFVSQLGGTCTRVDGSIIDCTCPAGTFVVSGGADAGFNSGNFVRESRAVSATTWRISCAAGIADTDCSTYSVVCSRIGVPNPSRDGAAAAKPPSPQQAGNPQRVPNPSRDGAAAAKPPSPHAP
jgi:hypothetical protein